MYKGRGSSRRCLQRNKKESGFKFSQLHLFLSQRSMSLRRSLACAMRTPRHLIQSSTWVRKKTLSTYCTSRFSSFAGVGQGNNQGEARFPFYPESPPNATEDFLYMPHIGGYRSIRDGEEDGHLYHFTKSVPKSTGMSLLLLLWRAVGGGEERGVDVEWFWY